MSPTQLVHYFPRTYWLFHTNYIIFHVACSTWSKVSGTRAINLRHFSSKLLWLCVDVIMCWRHIARRLLVSSWMQKLFLKLAWVSCPCISRWIQGFATYVKKVLLLSALKAQKKEMVCLIISLYVLQAPIHAQKRCGSACSRLRLARPHLVLQFCSPTLWLFHPLWMWLILRPH